MLKYFALTSFKERQKPSIDNAVLHLHYRATFIIFSVASSLMTAKEYFGTPISCLAKETVPSEVIDIYCYIMSTFSIPSHFPKPYGDGAPYPGLGNEFEKEIVYHAYYQWVPVMLFAQALMFYVPRFIWKRTEGGLFHIILSGLDKPVMDESEHDTQHEILADYMMKNLNLHTLYVWG